MAQRKRRAVKFRGDTKPPTMRVVGTIRNGDGWRVVSADVPVDILAQYAANDHEPDLKQLAQERVLNELWAE